MEITLDLPLLMRILELCREDIEDDVELHFLVDAIAQEQASADGVLGMDNYASIMKYKERYLFSKDANAENDL